MMFIESLQMPQYLRCIYLCWHTSEHSTTKATTLRKTYWIARVQSQPHLTFLFDLCPIYCIYIFNSNALITRKPTFLFQYLIKLHKLVIAEMANSNTKMSMTERNSRVLCHWKSFLYIEFDKISQVNSSGMKVLKKWA